jgi:hypothetical protein
MLRAKLPSPNVGVVIWKLSCYPLRVCCHQDGARLAQHSQAFEQAQKDTAPRKINVTSKSPVGDISVVTLIRTDTTLDHSQKAQKVCISMSIDSQTVCNAHMLRGLRGDYCMLACPCWSVVSSGLQLTISLGMVQL